MEKVVINSDKAPEAIGPYSQAILHSFKYTMELSGQLGIDPDSKKLKEKLEEQTEQALDNVEAILKEVGWIWDNVVKVRVYLANMGDFGVMNEIYAKRFQSDPPARAAVAVKELPLNALIEIECTACGNTIPEGFLE